MSDVYFTGQLNEKVVKLRVSHMIFLMTDAPILNTAISCCNDWLLKFENKDLSVTGVLVDVQEGTHTITFVT